VQKLYEGSKIFLVDVLILFLEDTYIHIDYGDVHIVMKVVLGRVQFWVHPPSNWLHCSVTFGMVFIWL